ncbi:uncharacterized protein LOC121381215 isoform X2 [Gigantopelta aegis]|uniref:uncharacterized protein LOC121381215 isoform X2 n=1 Tax=Gigantopelta aegis TaxID=1735272 RepID=UPI001B88BE1C|nr:uncharacterized protein LOC121381215 isoform X2 [Gigantopelta aegis]
MDFVNIFFPVVLIMFHITYNSAGDSPFSLKLNVTSLHYVNEGENMAVLCHTDCRQCKVVWTFKAETISRSGVLSLSNVSWPHIGIYTCVAYGDGTKPVHKNTTLKVHLYGQWTGWAFAARECLPTCSGFQTSKRMCLNLYDDITSGSPRCHGQSTISTEEKCCDTNLSGLVAGIVCGVLLLSGFGLYRYRRKRIIKRQDSKIYRSSIFTVGDWDTHSSEYPSFTLSNVAVPKDMKF